MKWLDSFWRSFVDLVFHLYWTYGRAAGWVFTALVTGLLLYLHLFAEPSTWQRGEHKGVPDLLFCEHDPLDWAVEAAPQVQAFFRQRGHALGKVGTSTCQHRCKDQDGEEWPCEPGHIVVSLRDARLDEEHPGQTVSTAKDGVILWALIQLPNELRNPSVSAEDMMANPYRFSRLPEDAAALVLAHEVGHALGFGHTVTPLGCATARKTGELMNPYLSHSGWGDHGLVREVP